jgi:hypothetical protein
MMHLGEELHPEGMQIQPQVDPLHACTRRKALAVIVVGQAHLASHRPDAGDFVHLHIHEHGLAAAICGVYVTPPTMGCSVFLQTAADASHVPTKAGPRAMLT